MRLLLLMLGVAVVGAVGRRVRVRPVSSVSSSEEVASPQQIEYYTEQEEDQGPVLVSRQDNYGRATGQARLSPKPKVHAERTPPVQTIRNYNKLNDDGSFTFGYEAADGSFKEETRGTDCVVRGKYGYIDPDGNKREFTYVSGNPCDPNAVEEEEEPVPDSGEENIPANIPRRKLQPRPQLAKSVRPATTLFQQDFNTASSEEEEEENIPVRRPQPTPGPTPRPILRQFPIPSFAQLEREIQPQVLRQTPKPKQILVTSPRAINITPRPTTPQPPATTYRPQLVQVSSPAPVYTVKQTRPAAGPTTPSSLNFDQELKNFQLENNVVTPKPNRPFKPSAPLGNQPIYTSELVFDPASGQYNTVVYQTIPQTQSDFSLRGRLQPYVAPQPQYYPPPHQRQPFIASQRAPPQPQPQPQPSQQLLFQTQQANLVAQSQQLFQAQQKKQAQQGKLNENLPPSLLQQEPHRFSPSPRPFHHPPPPPPPSQQFYYVAPPGLDRNNPAAGQIDAFLRGHSIAI